MKKSRLYITIVTLVAASFFFAACPTDSSLDDETPGTLLPEAGAQNITFIDIDLGENELAGMIVITPAADESTITSYLVYWGSSSDTKLNDTPIIEFDAGGTTLSYFLPPDTAVPSGATHILAFSKNDEGEMETGLGLAIPDEVGTVYSGSEGSSGSPVSLSAGYPYERNRQRTELLFHISDHEFYDNTVDGSHR